MLPHVAGDATALRQMLVALEDRALRATPPAYGLLMKRPIDAVVSDSYALPALRDPGVLHDASKVMRFASTPVVHAACRRLIAEFTRPVLFAWPPEDRVFPIAHAERYARPLRDGRVARIDDAYSFTPEDQPAPLAHAIAAFTSRC